MPDPFVSSDQALLELLREHESLSVSQMAELAGVTATAIRQRLTRLMDQELIQRTGEIQGRGRPQHRYSLTSSGRRKAGENFADLANVVWEEIVAIEDPELRLRMVRGVAKRMASQYASEMDGKTTEEKMQAVAKLFGSRQIPILVEKENQLPILSVQACPYPDLADKDHLICEMESVMFETLVGEQLSVDHCSSNGNCCRFEPVKQTTEETGPVEALGQDSDSERGEGKQDVRRRFPNVSAESADENSSDGLQRVNSLVDSKSGS